MPLTDDRVQEIERLRAGITNKPLRARKASDNTGDYGVMTYDEEPEGPAPDLLLAEVFERIGSNKIHDASFMAEFFAASPTIVDDLLAERRELLAVVKAARALIVAATGLQPIGVHRLAAALAAYDEAAT